MGKRARRRRRGKARGRSLAAGNPDSQAQSRKSRANRKTSRKARGGQDPGSRAMIPMSEGPIARGPDERTSTRLYLRMGSLEIAKGHDGLLRGMPEPVILIGVYCLDRRGARLVARFVYHFERPVRLPDKVEPREPSNERQVFTHDPGASLAIVALAVEEDNGRGVQDMFAALHHGDTIVVWTDEAGASTPRHLGELPEVWLERDVGRPVHLLIDDRDPARDLTGDDWIAAAIAVHDTARGRQHHRFRFVSQDGRNDWSAAFEFSLRRP